MAEKSASRTGRLLQEVRRTPMFRKHVPMEASIGWPVVERGPAGVRLVLPLFSTTREGARTLLHPPFATLSVDAGDGSPVAYTKVTPAPAGAAVGEFPHPGVRGPLREYRANRERLLGCYDALISSTRGGGRFAEEEEFRTLLGRLVEPSLLPYYRALAPDFYATHLPAG